MNSTNEWKDNAEKIKQKLDIITSNKALQAWINYKCGEEEKAVKYWESIAPEDNDRGIHSRRCLAVYYHQKAYELEISGDWKKAVDFWQKSLSHWGGLLNSKAFHGEIQSISKVGDDTYIDHKDIDQLLEVLGRFLLSPNVTLAQLEYNKDNHDRAKVHINTLKTIPFPDQIKKQSLNEVRDSICPIKHYGNINQTTYSNESAKEDERRGHFATEMFPEEPNGPLMLIAVVCWELKSSISENYFYDSVWNKYESCYKNGLLDKLAKISFNSDIRDNFLLQSQLKYYVTIGCEFEFNRINNSIEELNKDFNAISQQNKIRLTADKAQLARDILEEMNEKFTSDQLWLERMRERTSYIIGLR